MRKILDKLFDYTNKLIAMNAAHDCAKELYNIPGKVRLTPDGLWRTIAINQRIQLTNKQLNYAMRCLCNDAGGVIKDGCVWIDNNRAKVMCR
jgi:hypothetical protein